METRKLMLSICDLTKGQKIVKNSEQPRILMIAPIFYPYPPIFPEGMVNTKLALAMKKAGWHIDIIIAGNLKGLDRYPADGDKWKEIADHVHIVNMDQRKNRVWRLLNVVRGFVLTGQVLKGLEWSLEALNVAKKLNDKYNYDVILSRAIPDYAHIAALLVHKQTRIPWVANWNDPTPNHKFPPPYGKGPASPLAPYLDKWYHAICANCCWHTFPSERLREYMCSYLPGRIKEKSSTIPHVAMDKFSFEQIAHEGFSVCYAGTVLPPREVTVLLEGAKRFKKLMKNDDSFLIRFIVDKPDIVTECARDMGIEDVIRIEASRPYSQMPQALAMSDVLVILEAPLEDGIFIPAKLVDYAQIGRPILALSPAVGTLVDILSQHGGGIAVDCQSPDAVAQALKVLYDHWAEGTLSQAYESSALVSLFSEEHVLSLYRDLFEKIKVE